MERIAPDAMVEVPIAMPLVLVRLKPPPLMFDVQGVCEPPPPPTQTSLMAKHPEEMLNPVFEVVVPWAEMVRPAKVEVEVKFPLVAEIPPLKVEVPVPEVNT